MAQVPEQHGRTPQWAKVSLGVVKVRAHFRPEFLNRIDEFIVFKALQREDIKRIVLLQVERVRQRLAAKKMRLELEDSGLEFLAVSIPAQQVRAGWVTGAVLLP